MTSRLTISVLRPRLLTTQLLAGLLVVLALACADDPVEEGQSCHACAGDGGYYNQCSTYEVLPCEEGTECQESTGSCERRLVQGEVCDHRFCEEGLLCDLDGVCNPVAVLGERCSVDEHCSDGLGCLHGAESPELGTCEALSGAEGAPCEWGNLYVNSSERSEGIASRGCAEGLHCNPGPRPELTPEGLAALPGACRYGRNACGYQGTCEATGLGERGEGCVDDSGCADERCMVTQPPLGREDVEGFSCGDYPSCFEGPWPGLCLAPSDRGHLADCFDLRYDSDAAPCGPGLICEGRTCQAEHSYDAGACDEVYPEGTDADAVCAVGAVCSETCQ